MNRERKTLSPEEQHRKMLQTPIPRLVTQMAVPTVATQLITIIYNTADAFFVSKISNSASAAVGVAFSLMSLIQAIAFGIGMGAQSLISRSLGAKRDEDAKKYSSSACLLTLVMGTLLMVFGLIFIKPLMLLFGSTEEMLPHTTSYAFYILLAAPVISLTFALVCTLRAEGEAHFSMIGTMVGGLLNVALDPLFIFVFKMGTAGAGLATALSQLTTLIVLLVFFIRGKSIVTPTFRAVSRSIKEYILIIRTGIPTIFRQGLASVASAMLTVQARTVSLTPEEAIAAVTISNKVYLLIRNVIVGIGQGFQPVAGYNFGAGDLKRTKQSFWFAVLIGTALTAVAALAVAIFPSRVIAFFRDDPDIVRMGTEALLYNCAVVVLMPFSTYVNQLYQCLGYKPQATFLASLRQGICFLPFVFLLPPLFGYTGVALTQPASDTLTFLVCIPFTILFFKRLIYRKKGGVIS